MVAGSDNKFPKVILEEVLSDGSATTTPAADHRALFLGEDGALHLKDSAAAVTAVGGGLTSGTSFPGSPADGDLFYRSDRDILYRYRSSGTRWVSAHLYEVPLGVGNSLTTGLSATANIGRLAPDPDYDWWLEDFVTSTFVFSPNSGSDFWSITLNKVDAANAGTVVATRSTVSDGTSTWVNAATAIDAVFARATYKHINATATKNGSGGTFIFSASVKYRLIG